MRSGHYNVRPRYTCGSPAMVDKETALRVAAEERDAYEAALTGMMGARDQARARVLGLRGISEHLHEVGRAWRVHDLCTNELRERPLPSARRAKGRGFAFVVEPREGGFVVARVARGGGREIVEECDLVTDPAEAVRLAARENDRYGVAALDVYSITGTWPHTVARAPRAEHEGD